MNNDTFTKARTYGHSPRWNNGKLDSRLVQCRVHIICDGNSMILGEDKSKGKQAV
jgi:hypothetical protein